MRSDMTIPIARLVATRFAADEGPFRFSYSGTAYRAVRPQRGQMREFMQAGVELIGEPAPDGTAEVIEVLSAALDAAGLTRAVIGLGDADLYKQLLDELGVEGDSRAAVLDRLAAHDLVGLEAEVEALDIDDGARETLLRLPNIRGGAEVLEAAQEVGGAAVQRASGRLAATFEDAAPARRRRPHPARSGPPARPGLLLGRDRRGLRPGGRPRARRRRALRRADGSLRPPDARGRVRACTWSACTSHRPRRSASRRPKGRAHERLAEARGAPRRAV